MRGGVCAAIAQGCLAVLTAHPMAGTVRYSRRVPAMRKYVPAGRRHPRHSGGSAGAGEDVSVSWLREEVGTLRRQLGTLTRRGYAVQDPKARLYGLRPKRFDGLAPLEADDHNKEESR
jgi:hypothetical protein